ncbi:transcription factor IIH subunit 1 [Seminavis robusta]|uniref:Transcription factor IIH subunit 1 n=1 Tax=Seminavis robusta TaxID=568900 RepID=A0A9N8DJY3_9STRA|nr:transcription factor IIH subunit 1 [Seminavis robusta]|eukprot:Sro169_g075000.1 transcription factor IIH subunit 1 (676) ;mRNA; r:15652-17775
MEVDTQHHAAVENTTYHPVLFKKTEGSLMLTGEHFAFHPSSNSSPSLLPFSVVAKHQVSPANYPKPLLKVVLKDGKSLTFQLTDRQVLERIRKDVSSRLRRFHSNNGVVNGSNNSNHSPHGTVSSGKKRTHAELLQRNQRAKGPLVSIDDLDATALAVTRSSLLAANPSLRAQHKFLVEETKTVDEDDFWKTHDNLLQEEYAKICGMARAGTSSLLQSHLPLQGRVTLGVEEMRQIFVMYPAVHKAYEEKVPLELSDEQFWRKYLESEYFHRDRGRLGTAARNHAADASDDKQKAQQAANDQDARAAAVGTDDLFSRYDQKLRESTGGTAAARKTTKGRSTANAKKWGVNLAVGQFDLASTFQTERGKLLEGPRDVHPPNIADDGKGAKVIQKYNRHWAMVLHPEQAVAGSNLMDIARTSVVEVLQDDDDAKASGGVDKEMKRLVGFAMADKEDANHALGVGVDADEDGHDALTLKNVEAYYSGQAQRTEAAKPMTDDDMKRQAVFSQAISTKMKTLAASADGADATATLRQNCFPPAKLGRELLSALTKKMAQDSKTSAATLEAAKTLPEDFKKSLHSYFRRSSELLRHFFGLRRLEKQGNSGSYSKKLARIVEGMETFYREMEEMRKNFPQTETGELQRKMCLPIMDQLDWAFKLHREGTGGGGSGFVTIEEF